MKCRGAGVPGCRGAWVPGCVSALVLLLPLAVHAQSNEAPAPQAHHLQIITGLLWVGGTTLGAGDATLRTNATGTTPAPFTLFNAVTEMRAAPGFEGRVGFAITPTWSIEAGGSYATPEMLTTISRDSERSGTVLVSEQTEQFGFDVGVLWRTPIHVGGRLRPYLTGGAGYLRELHQDRALLETGRRYFVGGGGEYWLRGGHGPGKTFGVRAELRSAWRTGGIAMSDEARGFPEFLVLSVIGVP